MLHKIGVYFLCFMTCSKSYVMIGTFQSAKLVLK
nr:MAG TPA: hypothetical protein [Bacteriophage sp.]